jgi:hypothetical protein
MQRNEKDSFKYFIHLTSLPNSKIPYLPLELRQIIWDKAFKKTYIECNLCQKILFRFDNYLPNQIENYNHDNLFLNYSIINGVGLCWPCRYAEDIMF